MASLKVVDDRFLHERIKTWIHNYIKDNVLCLEVEGMFFHFSFQVNNPRFELRNYSNTFNILSIPVTNKTSLIDITIKDLRKFIQEFDVPYNKIRFGDLERINYYIKSNLEEIKNLEEQNKAFEFEKEEIFKLINLPLEFE